MFFNDFFTYSWQGSGILFNILKRGQGRAQRGRRPDHSVDALRSRRLPLLEESLLSLSLSLALSLLSSPSLSLSLSLSLSFSLSAFACILFKD